MAADNTQNQPNARWWNGPNVAGGGRAPGNGTGTVQSDATGPGTVYGGRHTAGEAKNQVGPNVAGAPRSVNNR